MFLGIEGPEGSGKGTLAERLETLFRSRGRVVVRSREPGGTEVGEEFRRVLKDPKHQGKFPPLSELFGFLAARAAYVQDIVKPALARGDIVITDRFSLSTMAYQIAGRGLPEMQSLMAIQLAEQGIHPVYIVLLVSPEIGLERKRTQGDDKDRFAQEELAYHRKVYDGYRQYGRRFGAIIIDTDKLDPERAFREVQLQLDARYRRELGPN